MAYTSQPFYGKLSSVTPQNENFQITTGNFSNGSNQFTIALSGLVRVGQTITYINSQFTGTVTVTNVSGQTITVDQTANANAGSGQTIGLNTAAGAYFINTSSLTDPAQELSVLEITGSEDTDFKISLTPKYSLIGQAANSGGTAINGRFHEYVITDVLYRDVSSAEIGFFIKWNENGTEAESGDQLFKGAAQSLPIAALTITESLSTIFNNDLAGMNTTLGGDVAGYQIALNNFFDKFTRLEAFLMRVKLN